MPKKLPQIQDYKTASGTGTVECFNGKMCDCDNEAVYDRGPDQVHPCVLKRLVPSEDHFGLDIEDF